MATLMPTTWPSMLNSGPPELPGLIAASVWIRSGSSARRRALGPDDWWRPVALMTPTVMVFCRSNGLPMAMAHWPGLTTESANVAAGQGRRPGSILTTARSLRKSG